MKYQDTKLTHKTTSRFSVFYTYIYTYIHTYMYVERKTGREGEHKFERVGGT